MNIWKKWVAGISLAVVVLLAVAIAMIAYLFRDRGPPPLLADITCRSHDCEVQDGLYIHALEKRFPVGTSENEMEQTLLSQGFEHEEVNVKKCSPSDAQGHVGEIMVTCPAWDMNWNPKKLLIYSWGQFPCGNNVGIQWSTDRSGRISHREAFAYYACL